MITLTASARCASCPDGAGPGPAGKVDAWAERHTEQAQHVTTVTAVPERRPEERGASEHR